MKRSHPLWLCRRCGKQQKDSRTHGARNAGLSLKCCWCGGICDPSPDAIRRMDLVRMRRTELSPRAWVGVEIVIAWDCWRRDCVTPPVIPSKHHD